MSTHCLNFTKRKDMPLSGRTRATKAVRSVLCAFLFALPLALFSFSSVFASVLHSTDTTAPEDIQRAGVSVVRLQAVYTDSKTQVASFAACTGLGVIIQSWVSTSANELNNWVLTDGNLVTTSDNTNCANASNSKLKLSSLTVYYSTAYSSQLVSVQADVKSVKCQLKDTCSAGPAVFGFATTSSNTLPYLDIAPIGAVSSTTVTPTDTTTATSTSAPTTTTEAGIALATTQQTSTPLQPFISDSKLASSYTTTLGQYLTPQRVPNTDTGGKTEAGTPFVSAIGELTGLHLNTITGTTLAVQDIMTFLNAVDKLQPSVTHVNPVHDQWKTGIDNLYLGPNGYSAAHTAFQSVATANPQFLGAKLLAQLTATTSGSSGSIGENTSTSQGASSKGISLFGMTLPSWLVLVVAAIAIVLLIVLLVVTSLFFGRARARQQRRVQQEFADAERLSRQQMQQMEAEQREQHQREQMARQQTLVPLPENALINTLPARSASATPMAAMPPVSPAASPVDLVCPNCGQHVQGDATYCPHCRYLLSPSESGMHLRAMAPPPPAAPSIAPLAPASSLNEQPTVEMSPSQSGQFGQPRSNGLVSDDTTAPIALQQMRGQRLGFVAGTRTDPGIKRKYKPNEDNLFAAQGARNGQMTPQPYGLFVVADGMGGHANGQEASRIAIQTIIDYILPRLLNESETASEALPTLLVEGVQHANQAVHQQNMDARADMGTTMTAALVVDSTAYIANVGDSRTYLYREPGGLSKITHDHSVVASLVDAGIIKPDDIYTHPKRNQIYRSLGEKSAVDVDSFAVPLQAGDKLLLCSDGLWDMVRDPQIEAVLKNQVADPNKTGDMLIQAALDGGGEDNVSVIVVNITDTGPNGMPHRIQLLYKPDTVQMPQL